MLLDRKRIGLILRVFSPKPELVQKNVQLVLDAVVTALSLRVKGKLVFSRIDVLVSAESGHRSKVFAYIKGVRDCAVSNLMRSRIYPGSVPQGANDIINACSGETVSLAVMFK